MPGQLTMNGDYWGRGLKPVKTQNPGGPRGVTDSSPTAAQKPAPPSPRAASEVTPIDAARDRGAQQSVISDVSSGLWAIAAIAIAVAVIFVKR